MRTIKDYEEINKAVRNEGVKNVTIVGAGFIGIETASAIKAALKEKVNVTVLEQANAPLAHVLGAQVGSVLSDLAHENGVNILSGVKIQSIVAGDNKKPKEVVLGNQRVPTDVLIMATGVKPAVDFAKELVEPEVCFC